MGKDLKITCFGRNSLSLELLVDASTIEGRKVTEADLVYKREMKQAPKPQFSISFLPRGTGV